MCELLASDGCCTARFILSVRKSIHQLLASAERLHRMEALLISPQKQPMLKGFEMRVTFVELSFLPA